MKYGTHPEQTMRSGPLFEAYPLDPTFLILFATQMQSIVRMISTKIEKYPKTCSK